MDATQWEKELGLVKPMEVVVSSTTTTLVPNTTRSNNTNTTARPQVITERRIRPQKEQALNCPRCNSTNTKFCYYNNYNLAQPRYFCKTCRRYWTVGGSLRNVPVGGGSRKNKKHPTSLSTATNTNNNTITTTTSTAVAAAEASVPVTLSNTGKTLHAEHLMPPQDLNLAFNHHAITEFNDNSSKSGTSVSAMELMRSEMSGIRPLGTYVPMQMQMQMQMPIAMHEYQHNPLAFGLAPELRGPAAVGFHLGAGNDASIAPADHYGSLQERSNGRLLFPFEQLKTEESVAPNNAVDHVEQNRSHQAQDQNTPGFWQGMINGDEGSW